MVEENYLMEQNNNQIFITSFVPLRVHYTQQILKCIFRKIPAFNEKPPQRKLSLEPTTQSTKKDEDGKEQRSPTSQDAVGKTAFKTIYVTRILATANIVFFFTAIV